MVRVFGVVRVLVWCGFLVWCGSPGPQTAQVSKHDSYDKQLLAKLAIAALEDRAHDCADNHDHDLTPPFKPPRLSRFV